MSRTLKWKWLFFFVGLAIMSLGISMIIEGKSMGVSPWDVLHIGLFKQLGLTIGSWTIITGLFIIITTSLYLKEWPKMATWFNMLLCGTFIDFFTWLLPNSKLLVFDILYFLMGVVVMGIGCAMYIAPKLGAGPRDTIMMIIVEKFGGSIRLARFLMETFAAVVGWILGGPIGFGTVIIALFSGYIIQPALPFFERQLSKRIAEPIIEEGAIDNAPQRERDLSIR
ncbi:YitT family protein [Lysinibacillus sp. BW-2-10]|uniref:YczE/YyaS/YitT family protein n=1 Tax=Lysinibacillus sp. BW-2-10 TaxID=2590030 RepID=UPI00118115F8|nr:YitT family protein [Lysinibacillus sp. BW-2-10]TSI11743.1 YitT family protein [Lysinibacillus sp. BW-2-10]